MDLSVDDETILAAMLDHPILVNRPIVCSPKGVRLCRPSETVLDLLDRLPLGPIYKENGAMVTCLRRVGELCSRLPCQRGYVNNRIPDADHHFAVLNIDLQLHRAACQFGKFACFAF